MGLKQELKRQWAFWVVIHFSGGMKTLVNQVEQPFARSLVVCDTPVEANSTFTGSAYCGDRLKVIGDGFSISSVGQAQENFAMLCSLTLVAIIAGAFGRKVAMLMGLAGTTLSVTLFTVASTSPELGRLLFAAGQGLQGLFPIDYLAGLILLDISSQPGADGMAAFQIAAYNGTLSGLIWGVGFGNLVQLLELSDYRAVWTVILAINVVVLLIAMGVMPETMKTKKTDEKVNESASRKLLNEVLSYRATLGDWKARRFLLMVFCESCWKHVPFGVLPVQLMAYHGWSQIRVVVLMFLMQPYGLLCMPLVGRCCHRFGYRRTWILCLFIVYGSLYTAVFSAGVTATVPMACLYMMATISGFMPLKGYVDSKFSTPEQMSRFTSVQWIMGYFLGMGVGPFYASTFDAKAEGYLARSLPNLLSTVPMAVQIAVIAWGMYEIDGGRDGFKVTLSIMDEAAVLLPEAFDLATKGTAPLDEEGWKGSGLEAAVGKPLKELGGPFSSHEALNQALVSVAPTNPEGLKLLKALKDAMPTMRKWAGKEAAASAEDKKEK